MTASIPLHGTQSSIPRIDQNGKPGQRLCPGGRSAAPSLLKVNNFDDAAEHPADRVTEAYEKRRVGDEARRDKQIDLPDQNEGQEHDDHRPAGIAAAPQRAGQHMVHAVEYHK